MADPVQQGTGYAAARVRGRSADGEPVRVSASLSLGGGRRDQINLHIGPVVVPITARQAHALRRDLDAALHFFAAKDVKEPPE